ncbi:Neuroserpin [Halotydeus destructor]|nr:Neuroserpin [Halotydeus destructor]
MNVVSALLAVIVLTTLNSSVGQTSCGSEALSLVNEFPFQVYKELSRQLSTQNVIFSPLSILFTLGMMLVGSEGDTSAILLRKFNSKSVSDFVDRFEGLVTCTQPSNGSKEETDAIQLASKVLVANGVTIKSSYRQSLNRTFLADIDHVNFRDDPRGVMDKVNDWAKRSTKGAISKFLADPLPGSTSVYILNAIYFKARWRTQFNKNNTRKGTFNNIDDSESRVDFMQVRASFSYYANSRVGYKLIELPYGQGVTMVILLPDKGKKVVNMVDEYDLTDTRSTISFKSTPVDVKLPKFKLEEEYKLSTTLSNLSLREVFSSRANFSAMTDDRVALDEVTLKSAIEVNEEGTEVAAVASAGLVRQIGPTYEEFHCDRPFLFYVRDDRLAHLSLFYGRITRNQLVVSIVIMFFYGFSMISSVLLFIGLCVDSKEILLPWLVFAPMSAILTIPFQVINQAKNVADYRRFIAGDSIILVVHITGFVVIMSQYQEYSAGRGTADHNNRLRLMSDPPLKNIDMEKVTRNRVVSFNDRIVGCNSTSRTSECSLGSPGNMRDRMALNSSKELLFTVERFNMAKEDTPLIVDEPKKPSSSIVQTAKP